MKKFNRLIAALLTAAMAFSCVPITAFAEYEWQIEDAKRYAAEDALLFSDDDDDDDDLTSDTTDATLSSASASYAVDATASGTCGDNLTWTLDGTVLSRILTISGTGEMEDYDSSDAVPWKDYQNLITSVIVEDGATSIGNCAFYSCPNLNSINLPDSLTSIGGWAFFKCISLANIDLPDSVTSIESYALYDCTGLTSIDLPDSLTSIGDFAFCGCKSLTSIDLPDSLTSIRGCAFGGCTNLKTITFRGDCPEFSPYGIVFDDVTATAYYPNTWTEVPDSNATGGTITWVAYDPETNPNPGDSEIIPSGTVTASGTYGYNLTWTLYDNDVLTISGTGVMTDYNSSSVVPWRNYQNTITSVVIEEGVTSIGVYAFEDCTNLTSIDLPDSVTSIGYCAFYGCTSLTSIALPDGLTSIGQNAFCGCTSLTSIDLPDSVTSIDIYAFYRCTSLTSIALPNSLTSIRVGAFEGCTSLTSIDLPNSLTSIGGGAFKGCTSLTSIDLPDSVTSIWQYAFYGCSSLTSIDLPDSVTSIRVGAFEGCTSLNTIKFAGDCPTFGDNCFKDVTATAYYPNTWTSVPDSDTTGGTITWVAYDPETNPNPGGGQAADTGSVEQVSAEAKAQNSYGSTTSKTAAEKEVQSATREFVAAMDDYLSVTKNALTQESKSTSTSKKTNGQKLKELNEKENLFELMHVKNLKTAQVDAVYEVLAAYYDEYISTGKTSGALGSIDFTKDEITISTKMVKAIQKNFNFENFNRVYNGHTVRVSFVGWGSAYVGYIYVDGIIAGSVASSTKETAKVLTAYVNELEGWAEDAEITAIKTVVTEMLKVTGIGSIAKKQIESILSDKVAILQSRGFGNVLKYWVALRDGYDICKDVLSASSGDLSSVLEGAEAIYNGLDKLDYSASNVNKKVVQVAMSKVSSAKDTLVSKFRNYISNFGTNNKTVETNEDGFWKKLVKFVFECPVDVYVYAADGTELGHVADDEIEFDSDKIYMDLTGDVKTVWIPSGLEAEIKLVGTDEGEMTYVVEQFENGLAVERANYYTIPLSDGCEYTQKIKGTESTVEEISALTDASGTYTPDEYLMAADETAHIEVIIDVEGNGTVFGEGLYPKGDSVMLLAMPDDEYSQFDGWYINGEWVGSEESYQFAGVEDVSVTAVFEQCSIDDGAFSVDMSETYEESMGVRVCKTEADATTNDIVISIPETETDTLTVSMKTYEADGSTDYDEEIETEFNGVCRFTIANVDIQSAEKVELYDESAALICVITQTDAKTIYLNANGGACSQSYVLTDESGKISSLPTPTKSGHTFDGWFTEDGEEMTEDTVFTESVTLYAHWEKNSATPSKKDDTTTTTSDDDSAALAVGALAVGAVAVGGLVYYMMPKADLPDSNLLQVTAGTETKALEVSAWGKEVTVKSEADAAVLTGARSYLEQLSAQGYEELTFKLTTSEKELLVFPVTKKVTVNLAELLGRTPENGTFTVVVE